jgi:hypothetical protein
MNINKAQLEAIASGVLDSLGEDENLYSPDNYTFEERILAGVANEVVRLLKQSLLDKDGNASRTLTQSIDTSGVRREGTGVVAPIVGESHWRYFEYGRKRGKRPPIKSIEEWITAKGIAVRKSKAESNQSVLDRRRSMAIAIANKIASKGTIKRFGYKGSGFVSEVLTSTNIQAISDIIAAKYGEKLAVYVTLPDNAQ